MHRSAFGDFSLCVQAQGHSSAEDKLLSAVYVHECNVKLHQLTFRFKLCE
jgi:hypothetical protein